jgi:hypothetical protein
MKGLTKYTIRKWLEWDDKVANAMDRAYEKKDRKVFDRWVRHWLKEERAEQRRWEKAMIDKYNY